MSTSIKSKDELLEYLSENPRVGSKLSYYKTHCEALGYSMRGMKGRFQDLGIWQYEGLRVTKITTDPKGQETTVKSLRSPKEVDTKGMRIKTVTDLSYGGQHVKYVNDNELNKDDVTEAIKDVLKEFDFDKKIEIPKVLTNEKALRLIISDRHLGLDPAKNSMFNYEYNEDIYREKMRGVETQIMREHSIHGTFDILYIDDLGDALDGQNKKTTRGGHELTQNMDNQAQFRVFFQSMLRICKFAIQSKVARKIIVRLVTNDNHSGDFASYVAIALKETINEIYDKELIEIDILEKFIEHRVYGDHTYLLTHGKDKSNRKFGLPKELDAKTINFVSDYIDHHSINTKYIHLDKGDMHQVGYTRTKRFDYRSHGSFAPPSTWVQANFGDCYSCYSVQVIPKYSNEITHTDIFIDYKKAV